MTIPTLPARWLAFSLLLLLALAMPASAETLGQKFAQADPASTVAIDHSAWEKLLQSYVVAGDDGLNRVDYAGFKKNGASALKRYLASLQQADVARLNRDEQFAFWANLYNAKTVDIILDHYPVASIKDIRLSGFLYAGPWDKKVVTVNRVPLSLNDIEHEILRPLWRDPRVHYAVNCASIGCPNLPREAFKAASLEAMLEGAARKYINSPRGVRAAGGKVVLSKVYNWFAEDFGSSTSDILTHIRRYAEPELATRIEKVTSVTGYAYDWGLNDTK